ncbi:MAG: 1,6-anhydro-N-acetylmuramyl-L-alanine amidase AmpD [Rhodocyclaceae bacterium]
MDEDGWLPGCRKVVSPNCDERPPGTTVELIVIHAISLPPNEFGGDGVERLFTNTLDQEDHPYYRQILPTRVSAHFFIRRDGTLVQFVPCGLRAWHAGVSHWRGRERCNDFSLGIELEGCDSLPFEDAQYAALVPLIAALQRHHPDAEIVGHAEIAPGRKTDPGPHFDWPRLKSLLGLERAD